MRGRKPAVEMRIEEAEFGLREALKRVREASVSGNATAITEALRVTIIVQKSLVKTVSALRALMRTKGRKNCVHPEESHRRSIHVFQGIRTESFSCRVCGAGEVAPPIVTKLEPSGFSAAGGF